jgi:hypothetical protein
MKKLRAFPLRAVLRKTLGSLALLMGVLGFIPLAVDPIPWFASLFPFHLDTVFGLIHIEQAYAQGLMTTLHTDGLVFGAAAGVSALMVLLAGILLVQDPLHAVKSLGSGIKASPMAILRSPITTYKRIVRVRNWILEKVEYLQSESAKWKTTFNIIKAPYSLLRAMGFSPQMAASFLIAGSAVGGGVVVNETILSERSFARGDSGTYAASLIGEDLPLDVPTEYIEGSNTLRIDLGSTPVREITIENVSVGTVFTGSALPSGEQNVVQISGNTISGGTNTRLEIGHLIFEKSRCKKLELSDIQAHTIIIRGNASDGQSIAPSPGTSRMLSIGGGHSQAESMVTSGGTYDRIWIQAPTSGVNGKVDTLRLTNLWTKGGLCVLSKMNIGTLEILLNEIGMGDGFSTKEFSVATTVTGANITIEDNVEVTIAEPATS